MRVAAVVADLDGTLVRSDFSLSAETRTSLDTLRKAGIPMIIATARTPPGVEYLLREADSVDIAVCCSGAIGWSRSRRAALWIEMLEATAVRLVVETAVDGGAGVAGFDGEVWRMTAEYDRLSPDQPKGPVRVVVTPEMLAQAPCCTMAIRHASTDITTFATMVPATAALSHVGRSTVLDITAGGIDKGTGASRALAALGIEPRSAISFGDMPNDLPLFRVTGRGFSVGTADAALVLAAHEVLAGVEDDGFAHKIADLEAAGWEVE